MSDCSHLHGSLREICEGSDRLAEPLRQTYLRMLRAEGIISEEAFKARERNDIQPSTDVAGVRLSLAAPDLPCQHRGEERDRLGCCGVVYRCEIHKLCTIGRNEWNWQSCKDCGDREA